jgi:F0F1-type ATP synthase delta subunit
MADEAGADALFLRDFEAALVKKYGAKAVRITAKANPELLCGYRWTIDGERRDYSLAGRLSQLEKVLKT